MKRRKESQEEEKSECSCGEGLGGRGDAPFGAEDTLFSGSRGMAELIDPNGTWIRIGNSTQIQFITLDTDLAEMDVASGVARFYNNPHSPTKHLGAKWFPVPFY